MRTAAISLVVFLILMMVILLIALGEGDYWTVKLRCRRKIGLETKIGAVADDHLRSV